MLFTSMTLLLPSPPPIDDLTQTIINFLGPFCADLTLKHLEIEAKLGVFVKSDSKLRITPPLVSEAAINPHKFDAHFYASVSPKQHFHFNQLLNQQVAQGIAYSHSVLVDNFHPSDERRGPLIRVTTLDNSSQIKQCVKKTRLANLDIYSPNDLFDWRVSVNSELPVDPPSSPSIRSRHKDRRTYTSSFAKIDLSQVTAAEEKSWELEMEIADIEDLRLHAVLHQSGKENKFAELVKAFVEQFRTFVTTRVAP